MLSFVRMWPLPRGVEIERRAFGIGAELKQQRLVVMISWLSTSHVGTAFGVSRLRVRYLVLRMI